MCMTKEPYTLQLTKETYARDKRNLSVWQKRPVLWQKIPTHVTKEPYAVELTRKTSQLPCLSPEANTSDKRAQHTWQKSPTHVTKETCIVDKKLTRKTSQLPCLSPEHVRKNSAASVYLCVAVCCSILQCVVLQCVTACCKVCSVAVCYSVL